jgi:hypothetical protein
MGFLSRLEGGLVIDAVRNPLSVRLRQEMDERAMPGACASGRDSSSRVCPFERSSAYASPQTGGDKFGLLSPISIAVSLPTCMKRAQRSRSRAVTSKCLHSDQSRFLHSDFHVLCTFLLVKVTQHLDTHAFRGHQNERRLCFPVVLDQHLQLQRRYLRFQPPDSCLAPPCRFRFDMAAAPGRRSSSVFSLQHYYARHSRQWEIAMSI